jgi:hypothetical protein
MENDKENWVTESLNSIEGLQRAQSPDTIYRKVMERIQSERFRIVPDTVPMGTVYRAAAAIAMIVALNTFSCIMFSKSKNEQKQLQAFMKEYSLSINNDGILNME